MVAAFLSAPALAASEPVRLLLSIGSNFGQPSEAPLQYAESDAVRVSELFTELGGVAGSRAAVLQRPTATQVRERLAEIAGRVSELHAQARTAELLVFVSAHGEKGELHLTGTTLALSELRGLMAKTGADLKLLLVDACQSGAAARLKGARKGPSYQLSIHPPAVTGEVFISSSGAEEPAQEWDVLGGSLFTHHWLTGLRGDADADGDGRVTLAEAFGYSSRRTVAESLDLGQHPEFEIQLQGTGDLVLTRPRQSPAQISLEAPLEGRFVLVRQPEASVVAELFKSRGRRVLLAVPSGRYLLRQTVGFKVALQELELPYGGTASVDGKALAVRDFSEVALKGGQPEFHPHALQALVGALGPPIENTPARWQAGVLYRLALGRYWLSASAWTAGASYRAIGLTTFERRYAGRLSGGMRFWLGPLILMPGAAVELAQTRQSYLRDGEEEILRSYPASAVLCLALAAAVACQSSPPAGTPGATGTDYQGEPLFTVSGQMSLVSGQAPSAPIRLAASWYPEQGQASAPQAILTQEVQYQGSFPLNYTFNFYGLPPKDALNEVVLGGQTYRVAWGILMAYEDRNGNGQLDTIPAQGSPVDHVLGTSIGDAFNGGSPAQQTWVAYIDGAVPPSWSGFSPGYNLWMNQAVAPPGTPVPLALDNTNELDFFVCEELISGASRSLDLPCNVPPTGGVRAGSSLGVEWSGAAQAISYTVSTWALSSAGSVPGTERVVSPSGARLETVSLTAPSTDDFHTLNVVAWSKNGFARAMGGSSASAVTMRSATLDVIPQNLQLAASGTLTRYTWAGQTADAIYLSAFDGVDLESTASVSVNSASLAYEQSYGLFALETAGLLTAGGTNTVAVSQSGKPNFTAQVALPGDFSLLAPPASVKKGNTLSLSWSSSAGAQSYQVWVTDSQGQNSFFESTAATSMTVSGFDALGTVYLSVAAVAPQQDRHLQGLVQQIAEVSVTP